MCYYQGRTGDERGGLALSRQRKRQQTEGQSRGENGSVGNLSSCQVVNIVGEKRLPIWDAVERSLKPRKWTLNWDYFFFVSHTLLCEKGSYGGDWERKRMREADWKWQRSSKSCVRSSRAEIKCVYSFDSKGHLDLRRWTEVNMRTNWLTLHSKQELYILINIVILLCWAS